MIALLLLSFLQSASAGDELPALQDEAASANPTLVAREAHVRELTERATVAGAWMDPVLAVEYSNAPVDSLGLSQHPMSGLQLKVQQPLHLPGWSARKRAVGEQMSEAAQHDRAEAELQLRAAVARGWWGLVRTRLLKKVTEDQIDRTEELLGAVTSRYEVGGGGQSAVLRLEVLRDRLTDDLQEFDAVDRSLSAALDRSLSRDSATVWETPGAVEPLAPPGDPGSWPDLVDERPALAALAAREAAEQAGGDAARADVLPDPSVWVGYRVRTIRTATDSGVDLVSAGVGVPIPIGSGRRANGERDAHAEAAHAVRAQQTALRDQIASGSHAVHARWSRAYNKAATYANSLVPSATSALEATQADFSVGRADFASLFEADVALLDLERARIDAAIETHLQLAEATALLGRPPTGGN